MRMRSRVGGIFGVCVAAALGLFSPIAVGQVPSDTCADAPLVSAGTIPFDTNFATADGPNACSVTENSPDVWVRYVSPTTGTVIFNTCGSDFDTVLSAHADCGAAEIVCNDDTCDLQSLIEVPVTAGVPIFIRITGYDGDTGTGVLNILAGPAHPWDEAIDGGGDAGELPGTAQTVSGEGPVDVIRGTLPVNDVDMFEIEICNAAAFSATTVGGSDFDTQLWLFDRDGRGLAFNDDALDTFQSALSGQFVPGNGRYMLAISGYDRDAISADGLAMWADAPFDTERSPDGPGAMGVVGSWSGSGGGGTYSIRLQGACRVSSGGGCVADVDDGSGTGTPDGGVTIEDLLFYLALFEDGDLRADVDNGTSTGTQDGGVTIDDLLYYLFRFEEGC